MTKRYVPEGYEFVPGRSQKKAAELIELAGERAAEVRTTTGGYLVPSDLLSNEAKNSEAPAEEAQEVEAENSEAPAEEAQKVEAFDPTEHNVEEVKAHLDGADEEERTRVLAAEQNGKARSSVLSYIPEGAK